MVGQETPMSQSRTPLYTFWAIRITGSLVPGDTWEERDEYIKEHFVDAPWIDEVGIQREKGKKNGIIHYQGTFKLKERKRFQTLNGLLKPDFPLVEWDNAKGYLQKSDSDKANRYALKEDTRMAGPWYKGATFEDIAKETVYKIDIDLRPWQKFFVKILAKGQDDRDIWWAWEPKGGLGKTTFQKWIHQNYKGVIISGGKAADMKHGVIRYREKTGFLPEIVLINLPKTFDHQYFSASGVEDIKDMFFFSGKYGEKDCDPIVNGKPPHVFIFANEEPDETKWSPDRLAIVRLPDGQGKRSSALKIDLSIEGPLDEYLI